MYDYFIVYLQLSIITILLHYYYYIIPTAGPPNTAMALQVSLLPPVPPGLPPPQPRGRGARLGRRGVRDPGGAVGVGVGERKPGALADGSGWAKPKGLVVI